MEALQILLGPFYLVSSFFKNYGSIKDISSSLSAANSETVAKLKKATGLAGATFSFLYYGILFLAFSWLMVRILRVFGIKPKSLLK